VINAFIVETDERYYSQNELKRSEATWRVKSGLFVFSGDNRLHGALVSTGATVVAQLGINDILFIALTDGLQGTFIFTGTAGNTLIRNDIRHLLFISSS
jgi:hypothetical protein